MDRRAFLGTLTVSLLAAPFAATAQQAGKISRIAVLTPAIGRNPISEVFEDALGTLGWTKGRNLVIEERYSAGQQDTIAPLAAELVGRAFDVLVAWGPHCAIALKAATRQIPVVFLVVGDPIEAGLVTSMAKPGGNLTGVTEYATLEVHAKRLQLLKDAVQGLNRVAILRSREDTQSSGARHAITAAVDGLGLTMLDAIVDTPASIETTMRTAKAQGAQAFYFFPSGFAYSYAQQISDAALSNKLPSVHPFREGAIAGTMLSYATTLVQIARRGAAYVDKILRGAKPGDIPVEQTADYELIINLKTAKILGLTIPPSLLQRADQVIE